MEVINGTESVGASGSYDSLAPPPEVKEEAKPPEKESTAAPAKPHKSKPHKAKPAKVKRQVTREVRMTKAAKKTKNGLQKVGMAVTVDVAKSIRKLRAQYELETGARPTISETIARALKSATKR